jgi:hypothetical protein
LTFDPLLESLSSQRPLAVALAGPNGAGKSTFFGTHLSDVGLRFVNADILAQQLGIGAYEAAALADNIRRKLLERQESFVFEAVFSDPAGEKLAFLNELGPVNTTQADGVASENPAKRGRVRRVWWFQIPGRERSMAGFSPQPEGTGPISPISLSLVAPVMHYSALLVPRTRKNRLPSPPPE